MGGHIENCYNYGDIILGDYWENDSDSASFLCGGIAGYSAGSFNNVYNIGNILNHLTNYHYLKVGLCAGQGKPAYEPEGLTNYYSLNRSFVDKSDFNYDVVIMTEAEMQSDNFLNTLNEGLDTPVWKKDTGINNGYPILSWQ